MMNKFSRIFMNSRINLLDCVALLGLEIELN